MKFWVKIAGISGKQGVEIEWHPESKINYFNTNSMWILENKKYLKFQFNIIGNIIGIARVTFRCCNE